MKSKIIWSLYALFFVFSVFIKTFATTETFSELGRAIDFSVPTLERLFSFGFYFAMFLLVVALRRTVSFAPKAITTILARNKAILPSVFFLATLLMVLIGYRSLVTIPYVQYRSLLSVLLVGFTGVILAPIVEEIFFRSIMLDHLIFDKKMSKPGAIVLGAILFYLPHAFNENAALLVLFFGFFVSIMFVYGRNILFVMLFHGIYNGFCMLSFSGILPTIEKAAAIVLALAAMPLLITAFVSLIRSVRDAVQQE